MITRTCFKSERPTNTASPYSDYLFSDQAILLPIAEALAEQQMLKFGEAVNIAEEGFPYPTCLKHTRIANILYTYCTIKGKSYRSNALLEKTYERAMRALSFYQRGLALSADQLAAENEADLSKSVPSIEHVLGNEIASKVTGGEILEQEAKFVIFSWFFNQRKDEELIASKIASIDPSTLGFSFERFAESNGGQRLAKHGITTIEELQLCDPRKIQGLFIFDIHVFFLALATLVPFDVVPFKKDLLSLVDKIKEKHLAVLQQRLGLTERGQMTLEEVGQLHGCTRERIRQIESKDTQIISQRGNRLSIISRFKEWFQENASEYGYWLLDDIRKQLDDPKAFLSLVASIETKSSDVIFTRHQDLGMVFEGSEDEIETIAQRMLENMPESMSAEEFEAYPEIVKKTLLYLKKYKLNSEGLYVIAAKRKRSLYLDLLAEVFPDGYKIYSEADYAQFVLAWKAKYGEGSIVPSATSVRGAVGAYWQQCEEGKYQLPEKCPKLTPELYKSICTFIDEHLPAVYYRSIYYWFETSLSELGFTNHSMFKAAFDRIDDKYAHVQDYLKDKDWAGTCYDAMVAKAKAIGDVFTLSKLRESFPYIEDYVFYFCFNNFKEVTHLYNEYFLYIDDETFEKKDLDDLADFIEKYLNASGMDSISCLKLYSKLKNADETDILGRLKYVINENALLAIIGRAMKDRFDTSFNYVGRKGKTAENRWHALELFIQTVDEFDKDVIDGAAEKYGFTANYTYMDVLNLAAPTHVQVSRDKAIEKELLGLPAELQATLASTLNTLVQGFGQIDTRHFNRYFLLPNIPGREWTKYLLAGIVRSYFANNYEVLPTDGDYRITDFIIRRKQA